MLAYYVEWHLRERLKPMLFDAEFLEQAQGQRPSPVAKAVRSEHARDKDASKHANDGLPLHSLGTLAARCQPRLYPVNHSASLNKLSKIKGLRSFDAQSSG
jgi:hypothetical protein